MEKIDGQHCRVPTVEGSHNATNPCTGRHTLCCLPLGAHTAIDGAVQPRQAQPPSVSTSHTAINLSGGPKPQTQGEQQHNRCGGVLHPSNAPRVPVPAVQRQHMGRGACITLPSSASHTLTGSWASVHQSIPPTHAQYVSLVTIPTHTPIGAPRPRDQDLGERRGYDHCPSLPPPVFPCSHHTTSIAHSIHADQAVSKPSGPPIFYHHPHPQTATAKKSSRPTRVRTPHLYLSK